jgi:hypothetical protein
MNDEAKAAIQQADLLIKEGKLNSARKTLLPYRNNPAAYKRLVWLEQKRQQAGQAEKPHNTKSSPRHRYPLLFLSGLVIIFGLGIVAIYALSPRENGLPTIVGEVIPRTPNLAASVSASSLVTQPLESENPEEVGLQQQLRDWFITVDGVHNVLSLDVDVPDDSSPLIYAEIVVSPGYNDTRIPDIFVQKLNETLGTMQYSDFVIILNDNSQVVEYMFDSDNIVWHQTELGSASPSNP